MRRKTRCDKRSTLSVAEGGYMRSLRLGMALCIIRGEYLPSFRWPSSNALSSQPDVREC